MLLEAARRWRGGGGGFKLRPGRGLDPARAQLAASSGVHKRWQAVSWGRFVGGAAAALASGVGLGTRRPFDPTNGASSGSSARTSSGSTTHATTTTTTTAAAAAAATDPGGAPF